MHKPIHKAFFMACTAKRFKRVLLPTLPAGGSIATTAADNQESRIREKLSVSYLQFLTITGILKIAILSFPCWLSNSGRERRESIKDIFCYTTVIFIQAKLMEKYQQDVSPTSSKDQEHRHGCAIK